MIVALEGPNGVGKTTLVNNYAKLHSDVLCRLSVPNIYYDCHDMKSYMLFDASALGSAFYFLSGLIEARKEDDNASYSNIIIDRSIWSTFAAAYSKDKNILPPLFEILASIKDYIHLPDMTIVLIASHETCKKRIGLKTHGQEFDKDNIEQFNRKTEFYYILEQRGYNIKFIDTDRMNKDEVMSNFVDLLVW